MDEKVKPRRSKLGEEFKMHRVKKEKRYTLKEFTKYKRFKAPRRDDNK